MKWWEQPVHSEGTRGMLRGVWGGREQTECMEASWQTAVLDGSDLLTENETVGGKVKRRPREHPESPTRCLGADRLKRTRGALLSYAPMTRS